MQLVDTLAATLSGAASVAIGLRSGMLKKDVRTKPNAPGYVTFTLATVAATFGGVSLNIWRGGHASWREVFCYAASAGAAWVLLANIARQKHGAAD